MSLNSLSLNSNPEEEDNLIFSTDNKQQYVKLELLGRGQYGEVYKSMNKYTGDITATKKIIKESSEGGIDSKTLREIVILRGLEHNNIVKLIDVIESKGVFYLIFEYLRNNFLESNHVFKIDNNMYVVGFLRNLFTFLLKQQELEEYKETAEKDFYNDAIQYFLTISIQVYNHFIQYIFREILIALKYIHMKKIIHRDLKPSNILVDYQEKTIEQTLIKCYIGIIEKLLINCQVEYIKSPGSKEIFNRKNYLEYILQASIKYFNINFNDEFKYDSIYSKNDFSYVEFNEYSNLHFDKKINHLNSPENKLTKDYLEIPSKKFKKSIESIDSKINCINSFSSNKIENNLTIKVADFGLARLQANQNFAFTQNMITLRYRPPELLMNSQNYNEKVDIWSVGCIFAEILIGEPIFKGTGEVTQLLKINEIIPCTKLNDDSNGNKFRSNGIKRIIRDKNSIIDDSAIDLIEELLIYSSENRLSAKNSLKSAFLNKKYI